MYFYFYKTKFKLEKGKIVSPPHSFFFSFIQKKGRSWLVEVHGREGETQHNCTVSTQCFCIMCLELQPDVGCGGGEEWWREVIWSFRDEDCSVCVWGMNEERSRAKGARSGKDGPSVFLSTKSFGLSTSPQYAVT